MNRFVAYLSLVALSLATLSSPAKSQVGFDGTVDSVEESYRVANFVVAYSTPQERDILSHYPVSDALPVTYQTARLVRVHEAMRALAAFRPPVKTIRTSSNAVLPTPIHELTVIERVKAGGDTLSVDLTVHLLDVRTNLRLIREYEDALIEGNAKPEPMAWNDLVNQNPWRKETHRWKQEGKHWQVVNDDLAMLRTRQ